MSPGKSTICVVINPPRLDFSNQCCRRLRAVNV